jgi:solute carrier family 25 folate transporter 32
LVAPLTWGLYFHTYHLLHDRFVTSDSPKDQSFSKNLLFAFLADIPVSLATHPLWMVRTRLCLQYENSAKPYKGIVDCFQKVYANEGGVRGLYKV